MQGLHHQQQQLVRLLSVSSSYDNDESSRLSAINSLHCAILYPPKSLLVAHSATFLSQGLSTLLSDKNGIKKNIGESSNAGQKDEEFLRHCEIIGMSKSKHEKFMRWCTAEHLRWEEDEKRPNPDPEVSPTFEKNNEKTAKISERSLKNPKLKRKLFE